MEEIYQRISNEDDFGEDINEISNIKEFFKGQTVLLTGCTGFLGKCFVEKLLRGCPDLKKLYLLVRPYKKTSHERIKTYFQYMFFDKLRQMYPNFMSKVAIIEGDLTKENLGISKEDREKILNEVTIIFHNASNVKFEAPVSVTLRCNVLGTKYMTDLAKDCKKLASFVYISTAYSHCQHQIIEEKCYPVMADLKMIQDLIEVDEKTSGGLSEVARNDACQPWPNMYSFSKAIAESLIEKCAPEVPFACIIYRPSIVLSTCQEPLVAWCGNFNGPAAIFSGLGLGIIHTAAPQKYVIDMVPADMCTNSLLAITWDATVNRKEKIGTAMVFNYGSSVVNPINLRQLREIAVEPGKSAPSVKMVAPYFFHMTTCIWYWWILHFFFHCIPAVLADIVLLATFQKPQATSIVWRISMNYNKINYWINGNWRIQVTETQKVWDRMNKRDSFSFFNDLRKFDWPTYCYPYWRGLRVYLIKDPMSTQAAGLQRYKIFQGALALVKILIGGYIGYYLLTCLLNIMFPLIHYAAIRISQMYA